MKEIILALALGGSSSPTEAELTTGLFCPTIEAAHIVANTPVSYSLARHIETAGCLFMGLSGSVVWESEHFAIGNTLYTFQTFSTPDGTVYRLNEIGEGSTA